MKKLYQKLLTLSLMGLLLMTTGNVMGQALVEEDFDYGASAGELTTLGSANWSAHSGSTGVKVNYLTTSLSLSGYASSGVAGSISISGSGAEDVNYGFTSQTSGTVYMSALVNLSTAGTGNYFMHFNASGFVTRIAAQSDGAAGVNFGVGTGSAITYGTTSYDLNTTYLLVASYEVATGVSNLYILNTAETVEPSTPEATSTGTSGSSITAISFRQSSGIADVNIDGVRAATSWSDLMPVLCTTPTTQASAAGATVDSDTQITVDWTRGDGDNVLVVAKEGGTVDAAPVSGTSYTADAAFGNGDDLGNGNLVVYNGTATSVPVTALTIGTAYHFEVFEYNTTDVCYLTPGVTATATTTGNALPTVETIATATAETTSDVVLTFSETINATDATGISISIGGVAATINNTTGINSATWTFTLAETIQANSGEILISYDASAGDLADVDAAPVSTFTDLVVTNNATLNIVANLTEARAIAQGQDVQITGEVFVSAVISNGDKIYIQDSGAGLLIDDNGTITTTYVAGDGITNLKGNLTNGNGVMELVPAADFGVPNSTANVISPIVVSIDEYNTNFETYESRVLKFVEVKFEAAGTEFDNGSDNYNVTDGVNILTWRDNDFAVRYENGTFIPYSRVDVVALGAEFNGSSQVVPFSLTEGILDNYAPVIDGDATPADTTTSSFKVTVSFDEPAKVQYLVNTSVTATQADVLASNTMVQVNNPADSALINVTGLTDNTQYYLHLVATDTTNANPQAAVTTVGAKTFEIIFDGTSNIVAAETPITAATISSVAATTEGDAVAVFNFMVVDSATTDNVPTEISSLVINNANGTLWSSVLAGVKITNGEDTVAVTSITDTELSFDFANPFIVENGGDTTFTVLAWFNTTQVDGAELAFEIPAVHSFVSETTGSAILTTLEAAITSATHTIDVVATDLVITATPSSVLIGEEFGFTVTASDANSNTDTAARQLTASTNASGVLGGTLAGAMTDGVYTYADLTYDTEGDFTVDVTDGALTAATASITATASVSGTLFFSEYIEGSSNNKALEIYNGSNLDADLSQYRIIRYNNGATDASDTLELSEVAATLVAGEVIVIANPGAAQAILDVADLTDEITFYNGNDALMLYRGEELIDAFGLVGEDPAGGGWSVAGVDIATKEYSLLRKLTTTTGNPTALASFGTDAASSEWIVNPQDDFTNIGFFGELTAPTIFAATANFNGDFGFVANGTSSEASSYVVSAQNLTAPLVVTAPAGFELSVLADFSTANDTLSFPQSAGNVTDTVIYVRFTPTTVDAVYSGDILHVSTDADTVRIAVSGTEGNLALSNIADVRANNTIGDLVKVTGIIIGGTNHSSASRVLQDNTAGITVRGFNFPTADLVVGDSIVIEGELSEFSGLLQLEPTAAITIVSQGNALPAAQLKSITEIGEGDESELVLVQNVKFVETGVFAGGGGAGNFRVANDAGDTLAFRLGSSNHPLVGTDIPTEYVNITAWVGQFNDVYQISPETAEDIEIIAITEPTLTVTAPANGFDFGTVLNGSTSAAESFMVTGDLLQENIVVTAPAAFEVSASAADGFGATLNLTVDAEGNLAATTIYVRFAPTANTGATFSGNVTVGSGDLPQEAITVTGTEEAIIPAIEITSDATTLDFGSVESGKVSAAQSFTVAGTNLTGDIVVTAPAGYKVGLSSDGEFAASVNAIVSQDGIVVETSIFVVFAPTVTGTINGDLSITSGELAEALALTGTATEAIPTANKKVLSGVKAYPNPSNGVVQIELSNTNTFSYQLIRMDGSVMLKGTARQSTAINIADVTTGLYLIEVVQGDKVFRTRIVKK